MAAEFKILPCLAQFPLENLSVGVEDEVCRVLFGWRDCADCTNKGGCMATGCPWVRRTQLGHYLQFYFETTKWSTPTDLSERRWALRDHYDLLSIVRLIKDQPSRRRRELMEAYFSTYGDPQPALADQKRAFDLAITVITMISCSECNPHYRNPMLAPVHWDDGTSACEFVRSRLPIGTDRGEPGNISRTASKLSVGALDRMGVTVYGTDDLRKHLLYDAEAKTVHIFHFVSFLEEQLQQTCSNPIVSHEMIPERLVTETLLTLKLFLFPWDDPASRTIAESHSFDPACLEVNLFDHAGGYAAQYNYWGARLRILVGVLDDRKQCRSMAAWLKQRSLLELATLATLFLGVIAILVAISSVAVDAWKVQGKDS